MSFKLDSNDVRIIELLQENGRIMYKDIADKLHISIPTVRARIERLRGFGLIKKFTVIVDPDKILGKIRALLLIQATPNRIEGVSQELSKMEEVRETYVAAGAVNILAKVEVRDVIDLGELVTKKLPQIAGVQSVSSMVITKTFKEEYGATVTQDAAIQFKCDFCGAAIVGRPLTEFIEGGKYYFSSEECLNAFREKLAKKKKK